ncbi:hypothetical protein FD754_006370 [Muntiacus muntjak]|uniref:Uncharacterized protein n=1 Tax=Muntiacus muntjak TaxID=9888 RepID=A0A5N3WL90_MUNMU|nr:hypothetical protein FD754_006370 [Muntiacus muntjak]
MYAQAHTCSHTHTNCCHQFFKKKKTFSSFGDSFEYLIQGSKSTQEKRNQMYIPFLALPFLKTSCLIHSKVKASFLSQMRFIDRQYTHRSTAQRGVKVCWVHHVTGMWVYPFLEHIGPGARILFFGSTTILMNFLYLLGEVLNSYIWDTQRRWSENQERKKPA